MSFITLCSEWRNEEMALIDELYAGPERKAALVGLLEQEAYLIASIDRHKLAADEENREKRVKNFLNKVCIGCMCIVYMLISILTVHPRCRNPKQSLKSHCNTCKYFL